MSTPSVSLSQLPLESKEFVAALFAPTDLIEIRAIETWQGAGKRQSRLLDRRWLNAQSLDSANSELARLNQRGANIFYGVNPRPHCGGAKADLTTCQTLWADLDDARPGDHERWRQLPSPSIVVDSGRGVHLYWRLNRPQSIQTLAAQQPLEAILRGMYAILRSDAVHDLTRLLRLPGFFNMRNFRSGQAPTTCRLIEHHPERQYELADFAQFAAPVRVPQGERLAAPGDLNALALPDQRSIRRIQGLLRLLAQETEDRSKRDYFVVIKLLELGCSRDEIARLVAEQSKFAGNEAYLHRTLDSATRALRIG